MPRPTPLSSVQTRRAFGYVLMSAVLPGSVQTFAGNRGIGRLVSRLFQVTTLLLLLVAVGLLLWRGPTVGLLLTPAVTATVRLVLWLLFVVWLAVLFDSWRLAQPLQLDRGRRLALMLTAVLLGTTVGAATTIAASALHAAQNVADVFQGGGQDQATRGRYNILLLGVDAGADRVGLRPDSINVASVDVETGSTVLFGLPRNLEQVRFPESSPLHKLYPTGYRCADECLLNSIYMLGEEHAQSYPGKDAGLTAMKEAVAETLGLSLNYYVLVDMNGFQGLVDALGGIRLNIGKDIPIGGGTSKITGYLEAGNNVHLDGYQALWFTRSRAESNDFERMARQKCVMHAMVKQLNPQTVATKFVELSEATGDIVRTDIGPGAIVELVELANKARTQPIDTVNFVPPLIATGNPDFELIRATVAETLDASHAAATATPTLSHAAKPSSSGQQPSRSAQPGTPQGQDEQPQQDTAAAEVPVCSVPS